MAADDPRRERRPVTALARVLGALAAAPRDRMGVREIARAIGAPPSSVQRTLTAAQEAGLVTADEAGRWEIGWELHRIASLAIGKDPFRLAAGDVLHELRERTGETALLAVFDPQRLARMWVAAAHSHHSVRFVPMLYTWLPAHAGASALAILAHRPEAERRALYARGLEPFTKTTITDPAALEEVLAQIRADGFRISEDEVDLGATAVAAPIHGAHGVSSSVALMIPRQRLDAARRATLPDIVAGAARTLAGRLGDPVVGMRAQLSANK